MENNNNNQHKTKICNGVKNIKSYFRCNENEKKIKYNKNINHNLPNEFDQFKMSGEGAETSHHV